MGDEFTDRWGAFIAEREDMVAARSAARLTDETVPHATPSLRLKVAGAIYDAYLTPVSPIGIPRGEDPPPVDEGSVVEFDINCQMFEDQPGYGVLEIRARQADTGAVARFPGLEIGYGAGPTTSVWGHLLRTILVFDLPGECWADEGTALSPEASRQVAESLQKSDPVPVWRLRRRHEGVRDDH